MKQSILAATVLFAAASSFAGVTYDMHSETTGLQQTVFDGAVASEGQNMKLTITSGDGMMFKTGMIALSRDGGKTLDVIDPSSKTYYEMAVDQMAGNIGATLQSGGLKVTFDKPEVTVKDAVDGGVIEGFPTQKIVVDASITMNIEGLGQPMSTKVTMHSESWSTDKIEASATNIFDQRGGMTGIEGFDKLMAAQAAPLKGRFPLKHLTTIHLMQNGADMATTTTALVSNVKRQTLDAAAFAVPSGYTRVENPLETMKKQR